MPEMKFSAGHSASGWLGVGLDREIAGSTPGRCIAGYFNSAFHPSGVDKSGYGGWNAEKSYLSALTGLTYTSY